MVTETKVGQSYGTSLIQRMVLHGVIPEAEILPRGRKIIFHNIEKILDPDHLKF